MTCPPCTNDCNEGRNCPARSSNEIIEMAQECGLIGIRPHLDGIYSESLEAFAKLVAAAEREALAQTQEPVCPDCKAGVLYECVACSSNNYPPQRKWVGLTDEELETLWLYFHGCCLADGRNISYEKAIEAKLKEKNF